MAAGVRPYTATDRDAVLEIAADTAFFGAPVEAFMEDRRLAQDFFVSYYLDHEPEHAWIAEVEGAVVGYLTGSTGGAKADRDRSATIRKATVRLITFQYRAGPLTRRYVLRAAKAMLAREYPRADEKLYPAELHINLVEAARGFGLGRKLLETCLDQMTSLGLPGIHLNTTSENGPAIRLYEKMGFELLGRRETDLWEPWLPGKRVANLCYGKRLTESD